ncbi:MAG TPA: arylesterase [Planctomycetota bacterium]|nr:arylesterase [Planctomycetota bacterium]
MFRLVLTLALVLAACSDDSAPPPALPGEAPAAEASIEASAPVEVPEDAPRVLVLGDSLAAGLHLSLDQAFPAVLQRLLVERGRPFQLVNAGVSGDTSAGGLARVDWVLRSEPDVVVVELGANDGLRGQPPEAIEANLRAIIERVRAGGAEVLLLGLRMPPSLGPGYAREFDALYGRVAEALDVPFVPFFMEGVAGVPELNLGDGIHPTPEGHRRLAENVAPALEELLGAAGR